MQHLEQKAPLQPRQSFSETTEFDKMFDYIGGLGRWQLQLFVISCYSLIVVGLGNMSSTFVTASPDHWCIIPEIYNRSEEFYHFLKNSSTESSGGDEHQCQYTTSDLSSFLGHKIASPEDGNSTPILCTEWAYDNSSFKSTIVTDWNLVCSHRWMKSTSQSIYMFGVLVGSVVVSEFSDLYGRRPTSVGSALLLVVCVAASSLSPNYTLYVILQFCSAVFYMGIFLPTYVLLMENVQPKSRGMVGMITGALFSVGVVILPGLSYLARGWRMLQIVIALWTLVTILYYWYLPESPRWLLQQGRKSEYIAGLEKAAKTNGKKDWKKLDFENRLNLKHLKTQPKRSLGSHLKQFFTSQIMLYTTPVIRTRTLVLAFCYFSTSLIFYGLSMNTENLQMSLRLAFVVGGIGEIIGIIIGTICIMKLRRRIVFSMSYAICGLACLGTLIVPDELDWLILVLMAVGKMFTAISFTAAFLLTAELYPTVIRNTAVGGNSLWARVGGAVAPYIVHMVGNIHFSIPMVVFGVLSLVSGAITWILPETRGKPLPETINDVIREEYKKNRKRTRRHLSESISGWVPETTRSTFSPS